DDTGRGHRHVDQEDRAPPEVVEQQAAEHRAGGDADADRRGPQADRAGAFGRLEDVGDDGERLRHDRGAAQAHRGPREDQLLGRPRVGREQRRDAEQRQPDHEHALATELVADHAEREQQAGEDQRVGVDGPFELTLTRAEAPARVGDGRHGHVKDGVVDDDGEQPDDQHAENHPAATVDALRVHVSLSGSLEACARNREGAGPDLCCLDQQLPGSGPIDTERSRIGIYFRPPEAFLCDPGHIGLRSVAACGSRSAWTARAAISSVAVWARPQVAEATVKTATTARSQSTSARFSATRYSVSSRLMRDSWYPCGRCLSAASTAAFMPVSCASASMLRRSSSSATSSGSSSWANATAMASPG